MPMSRSHFAKPPMKKSCTLTDCPLCRRLDAIHTTDDPYLIHVFEHCVFVIGEHQYHAGYAQVILKPHVTELHHLPGSIQGAHFQEVMTATAALVKTFAPSKMNHACYGNLDAHLHWHLFPRYASDPDHDKQPWLHAAQFPRHAIDARRAQELAARVRANLA